MCRIRGNYTQNKRINKNSSFHSVGRKWAVRRCCCCCFLVFCSVHLPGFIFRRVMVLRPRPQTTEEDEKKKQFNTPLYIIFNFRVVYSRIALPSFTRRRGVIVCLSIHLMLKKKNDENHTYDSRMQTKQASKLHTWPVELIQLPLFFFRSLLSIVHIHTENFACILTRSLNSRMTSLERGVVSNW